VGFEVVKICYGSGCIHELRSGECGKRSDDVCPEVFEDEDDYCEALKSLGNERYAHTDYEFERCY